MQLGNKKLDNNKSKDAISQSEVLSKNETSSIKKFFNPGISGKNKTGKNKLLKMAEDDQPNN